MSSFLSYLIYWDDFFASSDVGTITTGQWLVVPDPFQLCTTQRQIHISDTANASSPLPYGGTVLCENYLKRF
jgi:hypothetical protein